MHNKSEIISGSRGSPRHAPLSMDQHFIFVMQFVRKFCKVILVPFWLGFLQFTIDSVWKILDPPLATVLLIISS